MIDYLNQINRVKGGARGEEWGREGGSENGCRRWKRNKSGKARGSWGRLYGVVMAAKAISSRTKLAVSETRLDDAGIVRVFSLLFLSRISQYPISWINRIHRMSLAYCILLGKERTDGQMDQYTLCFCSITRYDWNFSKATLRQMWGMVWLLGFGGVVGWDGVMVRGVAASGLRTILQRTRSLIRGRKGCAHRCIQQRDTLSIGRGGYFLAERRWSYDPIAVCVTEHICPSIVCLLADRE
ncbi:hypothetical protein Tco_0741737 [Tanacetum coccineum]